MPLVRKTPAAPAVAAASADDVRSALIDGNEDERWSAARAAASRPDLVPLLGEALPREPVPRVREAMLTSLARIGTPESIEWLIPLLRSDDAQMRTSALDALRAMKSGMQPYVDRLLRDSDADVRLLACELARDLPDNDASRALADLLDRESDANVCAAAIEVLADVAGADALPALERCAERFQSTPFLVFSIRIAADRIRPQPGPSRG